MKKKQIITVLTGILLCLVFAIGLTACKKDEPGENNGYKIEVGTAYALAQESGYAGTLEEFIAAIKGEQGIQGLTGPAGNGITSILKTGTEENTDTYTITFTDGTTAVFTIVNGIDGQDGEKGDTGDKGDQGETGNGIAGIVKTDTNGDIDTYTITFTDGSTTTFTIINGVDGANGIQGEKGNGIEKIEKTGVNANIDTYRITFTDGGHFDFNIINGTDGATGNGIATIIKTSTSGNIDTYTITFTDGSKTTFTVTNGQNGENGQDGQDGETGNGIVSVIKTATNGKTDTYTITFTDGSTATFTVTNGTDGEDGEKGETGNGIVSITKTDTNGNIDTYTITFADDSITTFTIINGVDGENGIQGEAGNGIVSVIKTATNGKTDTYTITFTDGSTADFTVTNGTDGEDGEKGETGNGILSIVKTSSEGNTDTYTITFTDGTTTSFTMTNGADGEKGDKGDTGEQGQTGLSAYQIYLLYYPDYSGDEEQWIYDLVHGFISAEPAQYTVTFDTVGGTAIAQQLVEYGKKAAKPSDPTRTGYTFAGWYNQGEQWSFNGFLITDDTTITAQWTANTYTVSFDSGAGEAIEPITVTFGGNTVLPDAVLSEYTFTGWYYNDNLITSGNWVIAGNITLVADFVKTNRTITFNVSGAEEEIPDMVVTWGESYVLPDSPPYADHMFLGWYRNDELFEDGVWHIDSDINLVAKWNLYSGDFTFEQQGDTLTITGYSGLHSELTLPQTVSGKSVTAISANALAETNSVEKVTVPGSITVIGDNAFAGCANLQEVILHDGITSYGGGLFANCNRLETLVLSSTYNQALYTLFGTDINAVPLSLRTIRYASQSTAINATIWKNPVSNGNITLELAEGMTQITDETFIMGSYLTAIIIPASVTRIGAKSFQYATSLVSVIFKENSQLATVGNEAFRYCVALAAIEIPSKVTSIGEYAFGSVQGEITFAPGSLITSIAASAFREYYGTAIAIPSGVTSIGRFAFYNCSSLTSITIPSSVTSIGNNAFNNCSSLTSITIPSSVTSIGNDAFNNCSSLTSITIPSSVTSIGGWTFYNCSSLTSITILSSVVSIDNSSSFHGCDSISSVYINAIVPPSLPDTWGLVFGSNTNRLKIYVPEASLTAYKLASIWREYSGSIYSQSILDANGFAIDNGALVQYIGNATEVTIPDIVTSIGSYAFSKSLTSITIPSSVTSIGNYAFSNCSSLTSITIPSSVTSIGSFAFSGCSYLTSITLPFVGASAAATGSSALFGYIFGTSSYTGGTATSQYYSSGNSTTYYIPRNLKTVTIAGGASLQYGAFYNCSRLTSITILDSVTGIGANAFYGVTGEVVFAEDSIIATIGSYAFNGYQGTSIVIPSSITGMGQNAFSACNNLTVFCEAASKPVGWDDNWNPENRPVFWGCEPVKYSFVVNEGSPVEDITVVALPKSPYIVRDGWYFAGWYENPLFDGNRIQFPYYSAMDITLYAKWSDTVIGTEGLSFRLINNNTEYEVTGIGSATTAEIIIPMHYNGLPVTSIGDRAFENCSLLTSVHIYENVLSIGERAFASCSNLKTVYFYSVTPPQIGSDVFSGIWNASDFVIYVPAESLALYQAIDAGYWQSFAVSKIAANI